MCCCRGWNSSRNAIRRSRCDCRSDDPLTDLLRRPVDAAVRYGQPASGAQVALPLLPDCRRVLVAAPHYLALNGMPASPEDMSRHEALRYLVAARSADPLARRDRRPASGTAARRTSRRRRRRGRRRWALAGLGLACKSWPDVAQELASGQLVHVNPHWRGDPAPLHLIVPGRAQLRPRCGWSGTNSPTAGGVARAMPR